MATVTLEPTGEGSLSEGTYYGGTTNWQNMQDDSDKSYLRIAGDTGGYYHYHDWNFSASGIPEGAIINSVTIYMRAAYVSVNTDFYTTYNGTAYNQQRTNSASYVLKSTTWSNNPTTEEAWTISEIDAAKFGVCNGYGATAYLGIAYSEIYAVVDYSIAVPSVTTNDKSHITNLTTSGATLEGNITATGGENATVRGFEYDIDSGAPYAYSAYDSGDFGTGEYTKAISSLTAGKKYYYRAYATNSAGSGYGSEYSFITNALFYSTMGIKASKLNFSLYKIKKAIIGEICNKNTGISYTLKQSILCAPILLREITISRILNTLLEIVPIFRRTINIFSRNIITSLKLFSVRSICREISFTLLINIIAQRQYRTLFLFKKISTNINLGYHLNKLLNISRNIYVHISLITNVTKVLTFLKELYTKIGFNSKITKERSYVKSILAIIELISNRSGRRKRKTVKRTIRVINR